jgi:hypothetical protein
MTHSAIGSESCNVREMFTAPYPVVVFPPSLNALYKCKEFKKELYNGIPIVALHRVLQKRLHLMAYKLFIVQGECHIEP